MKKRKQWNGLRCLLVWTVAAVTVQAISLPVMGMEQKATGGVQDYKYETVYCTVEAPSCEPVHMESGWENVMAYCTYRLPGTDGSGTGLYTWVGLLQMTAAASLLFFQKKRDRTIS